MFSFRELYLWILSEIRVLMDPLKAFNKCKKDGKDQEMIQS